MLQEFSDWPTYPQLYVDGELLGGSDIIEEMQSSGELASALQEAVKAKGTADVAPDQGIVQATAMTMAAADHLDRLSSFH